LADWLGLSLATAMINRCAHAAARAIEPVVERGLREHVRNVELLYADETTGTELGRRLWLWVFTGRLGPRILSAAGARARWCSANSASTSVTG